MKYLYKHYLGPKSTVETHDYPKSRVKVGDIILPEDGSWALVVKDGKLVDEPVAYRPKRTNWRVLATEGRFPTEAFETVLYGQPVLPGTPFRDGKTHQWNDLMICRMTDNAIGFIHSSQVSIHKTASFFPSV